METANILESDTSINPQLLGTYPLYNEIVHPIIGYLNDTIGFKEKYSVPIGHIASTMYKTGRLDLLFVLLHAFLKTHRPIYHYSFDRLISVPYLDNILRLMRPCYYSEIDVIQASTISNYLQSRVIVFDWQYVNKDVLRCIQHLCGIDVLDHANRPIKDIALKIMDCSPHAAIMLVSHAYYGLARKYIDYNKKKAGYPQK